MDLSRLMAVTVIPAAVAIMIATLGTTHITMEETGIDPEILEIVEMVTGELGSGVIENAKGRVVRGVDHHFPHLGTRTPVMAIVITGMVPAIQIRPQKTTPSVVIIAYTMSVTNDLSPHQSEDGGREIRVSPIPPAERERRPC